MSDELKNMEDKASSEYTPSLTLTPFDEPVPAVPEKVEAEPVKIDDSLSTEEKKMVEDFAKQIDITNANMVLQYGAASQKR